VPHRFTRLTPALPARYDPHPIGEVGNVLIKDCTAWGIPSPLEASSRFLPHLMEIIHTASIEAAVSKAVRSEAYCCPTYPNFIP
jgi:hypothetical protein